MFDPDFFAAQLAELRDRHNETQGDAAERIEVSIKTYNAWARARTKRPHPASVERAAAAYGVSVAYLTGEGPMLEAGQGDREGLAIQRTDIAWCVNALDMLMRHLGLDPDAVQ